MKVHTHILVRLLLPPAARLQKHAESACICGLNSVYLQRAIIVPWAEAKRLRRLQQVVAYYVFVTSWQHQSAAFSRLSTCDPCHLYSGEGWCPTDDQQCLTHKLRLQNASFILHKQPDIAGRRKYLQANGSTTVDLAV